VSLFLALTLFVLLPAGSSAPPAGNLVTITPLGSADGEFCVGDRALLFEDPTGVRILTAPGRTVRGSGDPRIAPVGSIHVVLIDHAHTDHMGDVLHTNCAGTATTQFAFPNEGNAPEIAARHNSAMLVGGELPDFLSQKIKNVLGTSANTASCPAAGLDNLMVVPRTSPCVGVIRGGTRTVSTSSSGPGVKITTIPAFHAAGAPRAFLDNPNVPVGLTGYSGTETGYILRFTNGLTVLWTGDSGLIGDWATQSDFYRPNLAVVHAGDLFTMGPAEAAYAVNRIIKPRTVIPEHMNQVSTSGSKVSPGTKVELFRRLVHPAKVIIPLSGVPVYCDGQGNCRQG